MSVSVLSALVFHAYNSYFSRPGAAETLGAKKDVAGERVAGTKADARKDKDNIAPKGPSTLQCYSPETARNVILTSFFCIWPDNF